MPALTPVSWRLRRCDCRTLFAAVFFAVSSVGAQSITSTSALSFGSFAAIPGGGGGATIVVAPNGSRTAPSGGVFLVGNTDISAARFTLNGTPGAAFAVSLPVNSTVFLSDGNGHSMAVNGFDSTPRVTGTFFAGSQLLSVGATLVLGSNPVPGNYSGGFSITVIYQ